MMIFRLKTHVFLCTLLVLNLVNAATTDVETVQQKIERQQAEHAQLELALASEERFANFIEDEFKELEQKNQTLANQRDRLRQVLSEQFQKTLVQPSNPLEPHRLAYLKAHQAFERNLEALAAQEYTLLTKQNEVQVLRASLTELKDDIKRAQAQSLLSRINQARPMKIDNAIQCDDIESEPECQRRNVFLAKQKLAKAFLDDSMNGIRHNTLPSTQALLDTIDVKIKDAQISESTLTDDKLHQIIMTATVSGKIEPSGVCQLLNVELHYCLTKSNKVIPAAVN